MKGQMFFVYSDNEEIKYLKHL